MPGTTVSTIEPTNPSNDDASAPSSASKRIVLRHGATVGRYVILNVIGRGGMGVVYAAHDPQLDRQVALKLMLVKDGVEEAERLVREAKALAKLDDPHVVQVFDAGEVDGQVFVAMRLVDGEDLAVALSKRRRKEDLAQVTAWFIDAGRGLAAAHAARLIHRDFKPSNVLIDKHGRVAVTDFGIARERGKTHDPERRQLSGADQLMGTPAYMAPEQHAMDRATEASDQFAFCVSMWEALFDAHPFVAGDRSHLSAVEIGIAIFDGKLISPRKRRGVPRRISDALTRGLSRDQAERWPSMTALLAELTAVRTRARWPYAAAAGAVAIAATITQLWPRGAATGVPASCDDDTRMQTIWSPARRADLVERLAQSGRPYSARIADLVAQRVDAYVDRWTGMSHDACTASREHANPAAVRAAACLDGRYVELERFLDVLGQRAGVGLVDQGPYVFGRLLPPLDSCDGDIAPPAPAPEDDARVADYQRRLGAALADRIVVSANQANHELASVVTGAKSVSPSTAALAAYQIGRIDAERDAPEARQELLDAAELASANQLPVEAAGSLTALLDIVHRDEVDVLSMMARAQAAATHVPERKLDVEIAQGRALAHAHRFADADQSCRHALETATRLALPQAEDARACLIEALEGLGGSSAEPLIFEHSNALVHELGRDHPMIGDALELRARDRMRGGAYDDAFKLAEEALALRTQFYEISDYHLAESYRDLGMIETQRQQPDAALRDYEAGYQDVSLTEVRHPFLAAELLVGISRESHDPEYALQKAEHAAHVLRSPQTTAAVAEAAATLERWGLAENAATAALETTTISSDDKAMLQWVLARAIIGVHGDAAAAKKLAREARESMAAVGAGRASMVAEIDAWLAHR